MFDALLTAERRSEIQAAFAAWYDGLPSARHKPGKIKGRLQEMDEVGAPGTVAYSFKKGTRQPSPPQLVKLWKKTGNPAFLYTAGEKHIFRDRYPRKSMPPPDDWPDRETIGQKSSEPVAREDEGTCDVRALAQDIAGLAKKIGQLANLSPTDPARAEAARTIVLPAMKLFRQIIALHLPFPEAFEDLLGQLDTITRALGPKDIS